MIYMAIAGLTKILNLVGLLDLARIG